MLGIFIYMDIKKIILEEVNDFDWVKNVPTITPIGELVDGDTVKLRIPDTDLLDRVLYDCEEKWTSEDFTNIKFTIDGIDPRIKRRKLMTLIGWRRLTICHTII